MNLTERAEVHAALGDVRRLAIVDLLVPGDRTVAELADLSYLSGNLLAHHLDVLQTAGLIERRVSEGDRRRRYVSLRRDHMRPDFAVDSASPDTVAFICTHNSARSQFAAALWRRTTGGAAESAGSDPSPEVHPKAVRVASEFGVDLSRAKPGGYQRLSGRPELMVSVCDRAYEGGVPEADKHLHWSVPDPVPSGTVSAFRSAFTEIAERMMRLTDQ